MSLADPKLVTHSLLRPSESPQFEHLEHLIVSELCASVFLVGAPPSTTALIAIPCIVCVSPILKVIGVHAGPNVALVATYVGPPAILDEEGGAMRKNPLALSSEFAVTAGMDCTNPQPAAILIDLDSTLEPFHAQGLDVHVSNFITLNS